MAIVWKDTKHSTFRASLGRGLDIAIAYESMRQVPDSEPRWNVFVFGQRLEQREATPEAARVRAETVAQEWLNEALSKFEREIDHE